MTTSAIAPKNRPAEEAMIELLVTLVGEYEQRAYPRKKSPPAEMLAFTLAGQPRIRNPRR